MRILFLSHRLPYAPNRGDRIRAFHQLKLLAAHHEVHVVSLVHDEAEAAEISTLRSWVASATGVSVNRPSRMLAAVPSLFTTRPLTHVLLHSPEVQPTLRILLENVPVDVVMAYGTAMARYVFDPPLRTLPCLLDMIDVDSEKWTEMASSGALWMKPIYQREAWLLRRFERRAVERACATLVVNPRERQLLHSVLGPCGAIAVPNGIEVEAFQPPGPPAESAQVVFCGVFNYGPNEQGARWLASKVWPRVRRSRPDASLKLVGAHPTQAVRYLTRDPSIRVTGTVPDVRPFLWESAVSVAPLHLARGIQNKVLEAIGAGLPCVVTPQVMDGLPTAVHVACTPAATADAFADGIVSLLNQRADERRARANAVDLSTLAWPLQLRPILDLIRDCRCPSAQA